MNYRQSFLQKLRDMGSLLENLLGSILNCTTQGTPMSTVQGAFFRRILAVAYYRIPKDLLSNSQMPRPLWACRMQERSVYVGAHTSKPVVKVL